MRSFGCLKGVKIIKCNEITENIVNNEQNYYIVLFYKFVLIIILLYINTRSVTYTAGLHRLNKLVM